MKRIALILLVGVALSGQAPDPDAVLTRFRAGMLENLVDQPDYTCMETVERTRQTPGGAMMVQDTLRLEVALVDGHEMFAWPGAKQFEDRDLRELVPRGMFGNGNYGIYARILFGGGGHPFIYREGVTLDGRPALRYDYRVPLSLSGFTLRNEETSAVVGFHGSIFLDPATSDLRRLEVIAEDIPPQLQIKAAEDRIDYAPTKIGEEEFLLPKESALLIVSTDNISRNRVRFSGCRKFTGESSIIFEDEEFEEAAKVTLAEVQIPSGITLLLQLGDFAVANGAAGDPITATLTSAIRRNKENLVPKGAVAKGRILLLEKYSNGPLVKVTFTDLEWAGGHASLKLEFDSLATVSNSRRIRASREGDLLLPLSPPINLRGEILRYRTLP